MNSNAEGLNHLGFGDRTAKVMLSGGTKATPRTDGVTILPARTTLPAQRPGRLLSDCARRSKSSE